MNLFENILKNSAPKGINPVQDFMSGFTPTKQPTQVVQPQRPTMSLFSDEKEMYAKMKADNLPDETAFAMLKKRRTDLLGGNTKLSPDEQSMLLKMQADNIPAKQATAMIQKRRADQFQKKYDEGNILQK